LDVNIGDALRAIRKKIGMSQGDVFRNSGYTIDKSVISRIETGQIADPRVSTMIRICRALGISVEEFFRYAEEKGFISDDGQ
jgi:transcriptional regulator with XRE-family HTH domain